MKYLMVDGMGDASLLAKEPTVEEVRDNEDCCFLSVEIIRGDEIVIRKGVFLEASSEDEEDELDWEMLS